MNSEELLEDLQHTTALTSLTIWYRDLGDAKIGPLCKSLRNNNSLTHINLSYCWLTSSGLLLLGNALRGKEYLKKLTLQDIFPIFSEEAIANLSIALPGVEIHSSYGKYCH